MPYDGFDRRDRGRRFFLWFFVAGTVFILGFPLLFLVLASLRGPADYLPIEAEARWTLDNFTYFYFDRQLYTEILPNTLVFASWSLAISCVAALALAWHFERPKTCGTIWARILILAPMALPTPALAVAWIQLLGPNAGWINQMLRSLLGSASEAGPFNVFSMAGIIWCQGIAGVPVAYLLLSPAVRAIRCDMEEAGYVAGGRPWTVLSRISLPMIFPTVAGPLLILFLIALEQVDFPYILGPTAEINVLGTRILWEATTPSGLPNIGATSAGAMLILALAMGGLAVHGRIVGHQSKDFGAVLRAENSARWRPAWLSVVMWGLLGTYIVVSFVMPMIALLVQSLSDTGFPADGSGADLHGFGALARDDRFWRAAINTLIVACMAAAVGTFMGVGIGLCGASGSDRISVILSKFSMSSIAIPSLVVAFGAAVLFMSIPVGIYGTVGLLVIAYSYRIALSTRLAMGALAQVGSDLREAAAVSGARWLRTQVSVVLPLILPSIVASAAFLFVAGVKEFIIPLMLYSPNNVVLSVLLLQLQQAGNSSGAAATGIIMTLVTLAGVIVLVVADERLARVRGRR